MFGRVVASCVGAGVVWGTVAYIDSRGKSSSMEWGTDGLSRFGVDDSLYSRLAAFGNDVRFASERFRPVFAMTAEDGESADGTGERKAYPSSDTRGFYTVVRPSSGKKSGLRERFNAYVSDSDRDSLSLVEFIRCMCMLSEDDLDQDSNSVKRLPAEAVAQSKKLFESADIDGNGTLSYGEFCVLFTLLSTRRTKLRLAFKVFDEDGDGKLNQKQFIEVLNVFMADPCVTIKGDWKNGTKKGKKAKSLLRSAPHEARSLESLFTFFSSETSGGISFEDFWRVVDDLRWNMRAIEFSIYDPDGHGTIRLEDFRKILYHKPSTVTTSVKGNSVAAPVSDSTASGEENGAGGAGGASENMHVTWDMYRKFFDVVRESDGVLIAMDLFQTSKYNRAEGENILHNLHKRKMSREKHEDGESIVQGEGRKKSKVALPDYLVHSPKPMTDGLTHEEFGRVLSNCEGLPSLSSSEFAIFMSLFDQDHSGFISPREFAEVCELRRSFFSTYSPKYNQPKRNPMQQFAYCMQQLE